MSQSHRLSGRVVEDAENYLAAGQPPANTGADGNHPSVPQPRVGRRQLAKLQSFLSERDLAVLHSVGGLHLVTTRQIERLHFIAPERTSLAASRSTRRALARLHDLGLLTRLERRVGGVRAGSASFIWRLSPVGARLLGDDTRRRSREPSLAHLAHVLGVADLVVQLHERAEAGDVELLAVETEPTCWRPFVGHHGARTMLKPDLRVTLGIGEHELHWFVEFDRGTEYRIALTRKIAAYVAAWRDGGEQARAGVFPRVLWVVPDQRRTEVLSDVCGTASGVPEGMFAVAVTDQAITVLTSMSGGGS